MPDGRAHGARGAFAPWPGRPLDRDLAKEVKITFKPEQGLKLKRFKVDKKTFRAQQTQGSRPRSPRTRSIEHLVSVDGDGRAD